METRFLHPKVDCQGNLAEEKKRDESLEAPVAQRIDCQLPSLYRLQGLLMAGFPATHLDNCTDKRTRITRKKGYSGQLQFYRKNKIKIGLRIK